MENLNRAVLSDRRKQCCETLHPKFIGWNSNPIDALSALSPPKVATFKYDFTFPESVLLIRGDMIWMRLGNVFLRS